MINVTHIDRFKVIKLIGRGGQGEVIHVRDTDQKDYALKWLLPYVVNQGSTDRFLREFHSICHLISSQCDQGLRAGSVPESTVFHDGAGFR